MNYDASIIKSLVSPILGTYTLSGHAIPAIAIISGEQEYPPPGTQIDGIEAVVYLPTMSASDRLDGAMSKRKWEVLIKFWGTQTNPEILAKIDEIVAKMPWQLESLLHMPPVQSRMQPEIIRIIWMEYL